LILRSLRILIAGILRFINKPEKPERLDKQDRPEKPDKQERPDKPNRPDIRILKV
jgi:hypothetical protein